MAESLLNDVRSLRPVILEARACMDAVRRTPTAVTEALVGKSLFRLAISTEEGGLEATPAELLEILEELASADASPAWIVWNNTLPGLLSRYLGADARRGLFADQGLITANSTRPSGRAVPIDDGFEITGRWSLVSGCELASLFLLHCIIDGAPGAAPETLLAFLPKEACEVVDTWHSGGLRGTGSHDVVVNRVPVSAARTVAFTMPLQLDGPLYRMPFAATMSAGCAAVCLGVARSALHALFDLSHTKESPDPGPSLRERPSLHRLISQLDAAHTAARLLLHDTVHDVWRTCCDRQPVTAEQKARLWGGALHAGRTSKEVVRQAYDAAGTPALYASSPLDRAHRDIHAIGHHIVLNERWAEDAGRVMLGFEAAHPLF
jgi:alkylation response protein AidB-like acyl-CoA dehydrogenase